MPKPLSDAIGGGAGDETTLRRNRASLDAVVLRPRFLVDVSERDLSTPILGHTISFPVMIAPASVHHLVHP